MKDATRVEYMSKVFPGSHGDNHGVAKFGFIQERRYLGYRQLVGIIFTIVTIKYLRYYTKAITTKFSVIYAFRHDNSPYIANKHSVPHIQHIDILVYDLTRILYYEVIFAGAMGPSLSIVYGAAYFRELQVVEARWAARQRISDGGQFPVVRILDVRCYAKRVVGQYQT